MLDWLFGFVSGQEINLLKLISNYLENAELFLTYSRDLTWLVLVQILGIRIIANKYMNRTLLFGRAYVHYIALTCFF